MMELLRSRPGITVDELACSLDRSPRTVYRWLNEISTDLRIVVCCSNGGYYIRGGTGNGAVDLTAEELLALRLSLRSSPFGKGSPVGKHADSAWNKIRDAAADWKLQRLMELGESHDVAVTVLHSDADARVVETIEKAVSSSRRLHVLYRSQASNAVKNYVIDPYALAFRRHSWYVLAHSPEHGRVVQFKLARFRGARETGETFTRPDEFSVDRYFANSWEAWGGDDTVRVRIRFSPALAEMIAETKRHPTQTVVSQPDGSIIFEVTVSGIVEIASWVMGYGKEAEVLEPESLREYIRDHARGVLALYPSDSGERQFG